MINIVRINLFFQLHIDSRAAVLRFKLYTQPALPRLYLSREKFDKRYANRKRYSNTNSKLFVAVPHFRFLLSTELRTR